MLRICLTPDKEAPAEGKIGTTQLLGRSRVSHEYFPLSHRNLTCVNMSSVISVTLCLEQS